MNDWIVVLEYRASRGDHPFELSMVEALVERLREWHPVGIYHPERYAVQLQVGAPDPDEALRIAAHHQRQAARLTVAPAAFVRAEVLTVGEFETSWYQEAAGATTTAWPVDDRAMVCSEVYDATRALVGASSPADVTEILVTFVLAVGAAVYIEPGREHAEMLSAELSIGPDRRIHAVAARISVPGLILERWLPALLEDARRKLDLLHAP